jgi:Transposase DDE domain
MSTISQVSEALQWVLNEYPRMIERKTGFVQRSSVKLDGVTFVRGLVLGWMAEPEASYSQLRNCLGTLGMDVTSQAVEQRFGEASAKLLKEVLNEGVKQVISHEGVVPELFARFNGVYTQDGSILALPASMKEQYPGCGGKSPEVGLSSLRLEVRYELSHGGMSGPWITAGREAEHKGAAREEHLPQGSLFVGDGNYFTLSSMRVRGKAGCFWLVPAKANLHFYDPQGIKTDVVSYLKQHADEKVVDVQIQAGLKDRLPCRLIAVHLNREQRRVKARYTVYQPAASKGIQTRGPKGGKQAPKKKGRQKSKKTSKSRLQLADWVLILTNVPEELLSAQEALVVMRCRWQIELLWKLWKQYGKIDAWRSGKSARIETEISAKLLGLLIQHWMTILGCWQDPQRSLRKAQQVSQWAASALGFALVGEMSLSRVIARITGAMSKGCRINSRRKKPNTYQLVRDPTLIHS